MQSVIFRAQTGKVSHQNRYCTEKVVIQQIADLPAFIVILRYTAKFFVSILVALASTIKGDFETPGEPPRSTFSSTSWIPHLTLWRRKFLEIATWRTQKEAKTNNVTKDKLGPLRRRWFAGMIGLHLSDVSTVSLFSVGAGVFARHRHWKRVK